MSFSLFNLQIQNPIIEKKSEISTEVNFKSPIPHKITEIEISCPSIFDDISTKPGYPNPIYMSYPKDKFIFEQYKDNKKVWETKINLADFALDNTMFMSMSGWWHFYGGDDCYSLNETEINEYVTFYNSVVVDLKNQKVYRKKYIYEYQFTGNEQQINTSGIGTPGSYRVPGQPNTNNVTIEVAPNVYVRIPESNISLLKCSHFTFYNGSYPGGNPWDGCEFWSPTDIHFYRGNTGGNYNGSYSYTDFCTLASNEKANGTPITMYYIRNIQNFGNYHETYPGANSSYPIQQWSSEYLKCYSMGGGPEVTPEGIIYNSIIHHAKDKYPEIIDITNTAFGQHLLEQFANLQQYSGNITFKTQATTLTNNETTFPVLSIKYLDTPHVERT